MLRIPVVTTSLLLAATIASAQDMRPAEQVYKNIQVLKGVPAGEIIPTMHMIQTALGVACEHCHAMQRDSDSVAAKNTARAMYVMMSEINRARFEGKPIVTCFTCHQGNVTPQGIPSLPTSKLREEPETVAAPTLPSVDQILLKYIIALGGETAIRSVKTREVVGTQDIPTGPGGSVPMPAKLDRVQKAPNLLLDVFTADKLTMSSGFDGKLQWTRAQDGKVTSLEAGGIDVERAARAAALDEPLTLKQQYVRMTVDGTASINGKETYVVVGTPAANTPERLYFEAQTGLLLRKETYLETAAGHSPFRVEFDDYRRTGGGAMIPFVIRMSPAGPRTELDTTSTLRITTVTDNVPIDGGKFKKPESTPQPAAR